MGLTLKQDNTLESLFDKFAVDPNKEEKPEKKVKKTAKDDKEKPKD